MNIAFVVTVVSFGLLVIAFTVSGIVDWCNGIISTGRLNNSQFFGRCGMKIKEKIFRKQMKEWLQECMLVEIARVQVCREGDYRLAERGKEAAEVLESLARTYALRRQ